MQDIFLILIVIKRSRINPFKTIQKFLNKLNGKKYVKLAVIFTIILIFTLVSENYRAGYFARGIILGFLISLIDVIFEEPKR